MSRVANQHYQKLRQASEAAEEIGLTDDAYKWRVKEARYLNDQMRRFKESGRQSQVKRTLDMIDARSDMVLAQQKLMLELEKLDSAESIAAAEFNTKTLDSTLDAYLGVITRNAAAGDAILNDVKRLNLVASPAAAWKHVLGSMSSEAMIRDNNIYLPQLMDHLTAMISGDPFIGVEDEGYDPHKDNNYVERINKVARMIAQEGEGGEQLAQQYRDVMDKAMRIRRDQGHYRKFIQDRKARAEDLQAKLAADQYGGDKESLIRDLSSMNRMFAEDIENVTGQTWIEAEAKAQGAIEDDNWYTETKDLRDKLLADESKDGGRKEKMAELIAKRKFQWWAEQNNYKVGTAEFDENGKLLYYKPGPDDAVAILAASRLTQKKNDPLIPRWRPKEIARVSYRKDAGQPEVFSAFAMENGEAVEYLKIDTLADAPRYFRLTNGRYMPVENVDETAMNFRALASDRNGDGLPDDFIRPDEIKLGSGTLPPAMEVDPNSQGNYELAEDTLSSYGELLAPEPGDAVGSKRILTADGREIYIPPENLADYQTIEYGRKENRRKDKRSGGDAEGRYTSDSAAGEGGGGGGGSGGGVQSAKKAGVPWKMHAKRRLRELEQGQGLTTEQTQRQASDEDAEYSEAMPEEFTSADRDKVPRAVKRQQEKDERALGDAGRKSWLDSRKDKRELEQMKDDMTPEDPEKTALKTRWSQRRGARPTLPPEDSTLPAQVQGGPQPTYNDEGELIKPASYQVYEFNQPEKQAEAVEAAGGSTRGPTPGAAAIPSALRKAMKESGTEGRHKLNKAEQSHYAKKNRPFDLMGTRGESGEDLAPMQGYKTGEEQKAYKPSVLSVPTASKQLTREELVKRMQADAQKKLRE